MTIVFQRRDTRSRARITPLAPWSAFASSLLLLTYLAFVGEAIGCNYVLDGHAHHGNTQSETASHATCCVISNHDSAAIPSIGWLGVDSLRVVAQASHLDPVIPDSAFASSPPARAPPLS